MLTEIHRCGSPPPFIVCIRKQRLHNSPKAAHLLLGLDRIWTQTCRNPKSRVTGCLLQCVTALLWASTSVAPPWHLVAQPFHFLILCQLSEPAGLQKAWGKGGSVVTGWRGKGLLPGFSLSKQRRNLWQMASVEEQEAVLLLYHYVAHQAETVRNALGQRTDPHLLFPIQIFFLTSRKIFHLTQLRTLYS